jgi:hypothetical protein
MNLNLVRVCIPTKFRWIIQERDTVISIIVVSHRIERKEKSIESGVK